ncbi:response regulator [Parendozoicomonas sp. Alg238-R29]|uniref:response regulator n=1 Tax=Parendozoicomonas sp. Alg238-R29 TaxID=2993446 RepID=UPI00248F03E7|nr:response regulator [Parendozoicomonas sp. Alg238-R29]
MDTNVGYNVHYKNKKTYFFLIFFLISWSHAALGIVTISRTDFSQQITDPDYFLDKKGNLTIHDLERSEYSSSFSRWNDPQLVLPAQTHVWLRLVIRNITNSNSTLVLRTSFNDSPSPEIYFSPLSYETLNADTLQLQGKVFPKLKQIPVITGAGETTTVYIKVYSEHKPKLNLSLESPDNAVISNQLFFLQTGALLGINLLLLLFCAVKTIQERNSVQKSFFKSLSFLAGTLFIIQLAWTGIPIKLWSSLPLERYAFLHASLLIGYVCALQLARQILQTREGAKLADRILTLLMAVNIIASILTTIFLGLFTDPYLQILASLNAITLTAIGVARLYEGHQQASQWLTILIPFTIIQITLSLASTLVLPFNTLDIESFLLFASLMVIFGLIVIHPKEAPKQTPKESPPEETSHSITDWSHLGHELRTPMNGILGMAELMASTPLSNRQQDYLHTIQLSGQELLTLINQIVDVSKIDRGELAIATETFDLDDLLHNCIERYSYKAEQLGLDLACWIDSDVPNLLKGDTARISRILNTFMTHAINHTEQGELLLTAALSSSSTSSQLFPESSVTIRFMVQSSDNGAGYSTAAQSLKSKLREKINNSESSNGITLANQVINYLKGNSGASRSEQGTHYWVKLPLHESKDHIEQPVAATDLISYRALVVDDNDTCRNILVQQIQKLGLQVEQARDATEAMALLRTESTLNRPFDIALLDHQMPGISGIQLARRISDSADFKSLRIVMLTGLSQLPDSTLAAHTRINKVLTKPVSGKRLKKVLDEQLATKKAEAITSA